MAQADFKRDFVRLLASLANMSQPPYFDKSVRPTGDPIDISVPARIEVELFGRVPHVLDDATFDKYQDVYGVPGLDRPNDIFFPSCHFVIGIGDPDHARNLVTHMFEGTREAMDPKGCLRFELAGLLVSRTGASGALLAASPLAASEGVIALILPSFYEGGSFTFTYQGYEETYKLDSCFTNACFVSYLNGFKPTTSPITSGFRKALIYRSFYTPESVVNVPRHIVAFRTLLQRWRRNCRQSLPHIVFPVREYLDQDPSFLAHFCGTATEQGFEVFQATLTYREAGYVQKPGAIPEDMGTAERSKWEGFRTWLYVDQAWQVDNTGKPSKPVDLKALDLDDTVLARITVAGIQKVVERQVAKVVTTVPISGAGELFMLERGGTRTVLVIRPSS